MLVIVGSWLFFDAVSSHLFLASAFFTNRQADLVMISLHNNVIYCCSWHAVASCWTVHADPRHWYTDDQKPVSSQSTSEMRLNTLASIKTHAPALAMCTVYSFYSIYPKKQNRGCGYVFNFNHWQFFCLLPFFEEIAIPLQAVALPLILNTNKTFYLLIYHLKPCCYNFS